MIVLRSGWGLAAAAGVMLAGPMRAWSCPGCKEALFDPGQLAQRVATSQGYAWSIGLLLLMPVGLLAAITAWIIRAQRRRAH